MSRVWIMGILAVTGIAALKTFVIVYFVLPNGSSSTSLISGLFALFVALTAAVAYLSYSQLRKFMERQRKAKLAPGAGEPAAKETVILRYAHDWGLSQAEADVAIFVAKGFSNAEIAEMRGCAIATVKTQLGRIYSKSGLASRYQLIAFVTDEVCSMANEPVKAQVQIATRDVLPLVGRHKSTGPSQQRQLA